MTWQAITASASLFSLAFIAGLLNHSLFGLYHPVTDSITTPSLYVMVAWTIILVTQATWALYNVHALRAAGPEAPVLLNPFVITPAALILSGTGNLISVGSLFTWGWYMMVPSVILDMIAALILTFAAVTIAAELRNFKDQLISDGKEKEVFFLKICVLNGIASFATFHVIGIFVKVAMILSAIKNNGLGVEGASVLCLHLLLAGQVLFTVVDAVCRDKQTRFIMSPYLCTILYCTAAMFHNSDTKSSFLMAVILGISTLGLVFKVIVSFFTPAGWIVLDPSVVKDSMFLKKALECKNTGTETIKVHLLEDF